MECPTLPLDVMFNCKDMLHQRFDTVQGPLWRVQLITEASMDLANLGFGPELQAILEDDEPQVGWLFREQIMSFLSKTFELIALQSSCANSSRG